MIGSKASKPVQERLWSKHFTLLVLATTLFTGTYYLLLSVLPLHMANLGASKVEIGFLMALFFVTSLFLRIYAGYLGDRRGRKGLLWSCVLLTLLAPLLLFFPSLSMVALAQLIFGYTIGAFTVLVIALVTDNVSSSQVGQAIGVHSISLVLAKGMAPALGLLIFFRFEGLSLLLVMSFSLALVTALILPFLKEKTVSRGGATAAPIPFRQTLRSPYVLIPGLTLFTITFTNGAIVTMLPLFALQQAIPSFELFFVFNTVAVVVIRLFTGLLERFSSYQLIVFSLLVVAVAMVALAFASSLPYLLLVATLYGLGFGAMYPALTALVIEKTPAATRGSAMGVYTSFFDVGVSAGALWAGLSQFLGFQLMYLSSALLPLIGLLLFIQMKRRTSRA
ncbi:MFS transporter [Heliorestis convoluta]|nr:MFS transporter [Heliorestis convoluta]